VRGALQLSGRNPSWMMRPWPGRFRKRDRKQILQLQCGTSAPGSKRRGYNGRETQRLGQGVVGGNRRGVRPREAGTELELEPDRVVEAALVLACGGQVDRILLEAPIRWRWRRCRIDLSPLPPMQGGRCRDRDRDTYKIGAF